MKGLNETQEYVDQLSKEIRTMSYLLHPPLLDESGLPVALRWYAEGLAERSGMKISVNIPDNLGRFGRDMELMMFRLVQECLTNIHRHSGSKTLKSPCGRTAARWAWMFATTGREFRRNAGLDSGARRRRGHPRDARTYTSIPWA